MRFEFKNKKITGLLTVVPKNESRFVDEISNYNFTEKQSLKLKAIMGYDRHRIAPAGMTVSDLCVAGLEHLFNSGKLVKDDIDALVLVTQSPDFIMPSTSYVIQGRLGLKKDMICLDLNQGCAGFIVGLIQSYLLLEQESIKKVVLLNAEVLSHRVSKRDRNSFPLIGDAASVCVIERSPAVSKIHATLTTDGARGHALQIPAGGFRLPSSPETAELRMDAAGNYRALDHLVMEGDAVFNFVQNEVPPMVDELLDFAGVEKDRVDAYFFHQPNRFMLQKLADRLEVPREKLPCNVVENFGNASGVSIPTAICLNAAETLQKETILACLAGFGSGLTLGGMLMEIGSFKFCEIFEL